MKNIRNSIILIVSAITLPLLAESATANSKEIAIYVSPQGNDAWSGANANPSAASGTGPLATLGQAKLKVRDILVARPNTPVTVYVRGGTYYLPETLELGDKDSGTAQTPVTYRSYPNETVVLSGARLISGFTPYKGEILKTDVSTQGLAGNYFRDLFFNGSRQNLARYPNFDAKNPATGGWAFADGTKIDKQTNIPNESKIQFTARSADIHAWAHPEEGEVFVFPRYNWWNNISQIASVDRNTRLITLKTQASYGIRPGDRYYVRNLLEELDAPGEWYLDKATNILYFWPPSALANAKVEAPALQNIFKIDSGVSYVTLQGFTIEGSTKSAIVVANNTSHCVIAGNIIRHAGDYSSNAVDVSGAANAVIGNDIYDVGASAIHITGGDVPTLVPAGNYADNNYIHHVGVDYKQGAGIFIEGVGNRASHNLIHDTPRFGILFFGNKHIIEFNHVRDTNLETEDTGAIYTHGQNWIGPRGSVIRGNYVHDTHGLDFATGVPVTPFYSWGIYLDDYSASVTVDGNIITGAYNAAINVHTGSFNNITNNILVDSRNAQLSYGGTKIDSPEWPSGLPHLVKNYSSIAQNPAWSGLPDPQKAALPDKTLMQGNNFNHNILYNRNPDSPLYHFYGFNPAYNSLDYNLIYNFNHPVIADDNKESLSAWQTRTGMDKNSRIDDPVFVDPAHGNYDLQSNSPAFTMGIKTTPMENIGPYQDARRASWPIAEAQGARELGNH